MLTTAGPESLEGEPARSLASDVCEQFDAEAFSDGFLRRLRNYAAEPIGPDDLADGGRELAGCLLPPSVCAAFFAQLQSGTSEQIPVRVRLAPTSLALAALPFEFAFVTGLGHGATGGFLALHPNLHLVREVDAPRSDDDTLGRDNDAHPIRVLAVSADPGTARYPHLPHIDGELESLTTALRNAPDLRRSFQVDVLRHATPESLRRRIADIRPHVLHFLGHADSRPTGAFLVLLGERGAEAALPIDTLAGYLSQAPIRIVVLSACGTPANVHRLAEALIRSGGADDVVAMQLPVRDALTRPFSRVLYSAYAEGGGIEDCVWQARQVIQGAGADWGVPVVYRRAQGMDAAGVAIDTPSSPTAAERSREETPVDETPALPELERPFIGRRQAVEAVLQKVRAQEQRLVTITGIGGMGKTTLSIQCARLLREEFPGSVFYVSVDALEGREAIVSALCAAFRIDPASAVKPETALIQGVRKWRGSKRVILVIDCFETHIANADLVDALLRANLALSCVVTSRIALGLPQEFQYPLDPMTTAAIPELTPSRPARPRRSARSEAKADTESAELPGVLLTDSVALFREAARHVAPDFDVDATNEESVEALCRQLEGVPLALVLAASRLRHLSVDELLLQVSARPLKILRRRRVGVESADRHADLQEVIAGSFALLDDIDREALQQFGVFVGGFGVDAALAVCDLEPDGDVLDGLSRLREHSLIQIDSRNGRTRYRLLDTVREYVSGLAGEDSSGANSEMLQACRRRHARHFMAVAQALRAATRQADNASALAQFWTELGNLRAATAYAVETNGVDMLVSFADALARLYAEAGLWGDFDALTAAAQSAHEHREEPVLRLRLLAYRAQMARRRGAETEARALLERIREDCAARGDIPSEADALFELASQARDLGELDRTRELLDQAARLAESAGLAGIVSNARALLASVACARGDRARGEALATEAVDLLDSSTDRDCEIFTCVNVGRLWRESGVLTRAEPILLRALQASLDGGRTFGASRALLELGPVYEAQERLGLAARAYLAAERLHADLDASRRLEAATALRRFRRVHGAAPEVVAVTSAARFAPWNELAAQLLAEGSRSGAS